MPRYVEGSDRYQVTLLPECLDDYIADDYHALLPWRIDLALA